MASPDQLLPDFRTRFPEFSGEVDARLLMYLGDACAVHSCSKKATQYLAAHFLTLDNETGAGIADRGADVDDGDGIVTSERVGAVATTFANNASANPKDGTYQTTAYGRRYIQFRNAAPGYRVSMRSR